MELAVDVESNNNSDYKDKGEGQAEEETDQEMNDYKPPNLKYSNKRSSIAAESNEYDQNHYASIDSQLGKLDQNNNKPGSHRSSNKMQDKRFSNSSLANEGEDLNETDPEVHKDNNSLDRDENHLSFSSRDNTSN